jgi:pilus assembly protein CpaB
MDRKGALFLLAAAVLAVAAGGAIYLYLQEVQAKPAVTTETVPVVVATKDMTFGTTLKDADIKVVAFPRDAVPAGSYGAVDSVLSQTTKVFLQQGEPVLSSKLSAIGGGLSVRVSPNMRAMSLNVNDVTGVSGFVLPGDRVDVIVTVDNVGGSNVAVTKTILQDIEVLAAGVKTENKNNQHITVQTVTVLVEPEGAEKLALGVFQGKVHLALRNPVDRTVVAETRTDTRNVMGLNPERKQPATPVKRATPPPQPVVTQKEPVKVDPKFTVIKDGKITEQKSPTGGSEEGSGDGKK